MANSLHNLSGLYRFQGRYAEGEPLAKRALDIEMKALGPDHPKLAANLINLAFFYSHDRRFAEAESLMLRAIEIREKNNVSIAGGLANLTAIKILQGKYAEAAAIEQKLLASEEKRLGPNHPGLAQTLARLAHTLFLADPHQVDMALPFIERAVGIYDSTGQDPVWRINAHAWRAQMRKQKGDFGGAVADLAEALSSTEKLRPQVGAGEETQAAFWEQYVDLFNRMVAWQLEAGHLEPALEYAERGRARVMLDQLAAGQIDLRNSIPENLRAPLLNRETAAKARMAEYQQRLTLLRSRKDLSDEQKKRENETLKDSLRAAEQDYQQVYEEIKYTSPLWHNLLTAAGQPVMLATIQEQLIPENGLMLIYQIGKQGSHLFVIPPASHKPEAITLQVSENLAAALGIEAGSLTSTALQKILLGQGKNGSAGGLLRQLSSRNAETASFNSILKKLWQVLIPATLWPRLVECTEVIIIPDGVLHLLPFEALVVDDLRQTRYWLDEGPAIRYAPSATTLYNLEQRAETRPSPSNGQAVVLSLSDPIFDPQKVAWAQQEQKSKEPTASLGDTDSLSVSFALRNSFERAGGVLLRLPGTARETEKISKAFNKNRVTTLMRLDANEAKLRTELPGKRYLHLATHGLVDQQRSTLFAALALTPPPAATEVAENDGFLQLYEIYELKLPECELAVLSACESNFGRYFEGEGIFALSRGFLAAGARRVIASHWALDDLSTAELISAFFRQIARDEKAGEKKIDYVRALRDAKRTVRNQKQWAAPCDWAPFILTGKR
ncbi:MAG: CHAT domain-containing protein [candidate division KSB1 bacterium]|nr:CHAT domain-containing protein [candidate division KSB1 bacterium]